MHPHQENIWGIVVLTGTRIQAANSVIRTATPIVTGTVTTAAMTVTGTETPMVVIAVTGVTVVVRLLAVDVTHLITGDVGVIQKAPREVAALAKIMMVLPMAPLILPTMPKMAVVGEVITCGLNMSCSLFICLFLAEGRARTNEGFMADTPNRRQVYQSFSLLPSLKKPAPGSVYQKKIKSQVFFRLFLLVFPIMPFVPLYYFVLHYQVLVKTRWSSLRYVGNTCMKTCQGSKYKDPFGIDFVS